MAPRHLLLALGLAAVWGVNFVVIRVGLDHFPPLLFSALRFLVSAVPAILVLRHPGVRWRWVASVVLIGERLGRRQVVGLVVALAGVGLIAFDLGTASPLGAFLLVLGAAAAWGLSNVATRQASPPNMMRFMVWVSALATLPLFALSALVERPARGLAAVRAVTWPALGAVVFVGLVATVAGFGVWGYLIRTYSASTVAPVSLLVPVFGMAAAALSLGERITTTHLVAGVLIVAGVLAGLTAPRARSARRAAPPASDPVPPVSRGSR